jgi:2-methylcitrate dehydratase PrpD
LEQLIAQRVLGTQFAELDQRTLVATKHHILHTLVTAVAGSNAPGIKAIFDLAEDAGGPAESRALVYGTRMSAMNAALVNAAMAHAQDYDMNDDRTFYKSSVVVIPVALAFADRDGGVTGRDFIAAVCVGIDLGIRIALAVNPKPSHVLSQMIGGFGAVATAARLLRLDEEQFLDALGIAYCQVSASGSSTASPALTKRLLPGLAARSAVFAALLGQKGFKAGRNVLKGPNGYFNRYHGTEGDHSEIVAELGERWELANVGPKGYPCCRVLHAPIDAALALVKEHDIRVDEVEKIVVRGSRANVFLMADAITEEGIERRRHPRGVVDAQFSIHWAVAAAIVRRNVFVDCFTEAAIKDAEINALAARVEVIAAHTMERDDILLAPASVEVRTRARGTFSKLIDFAKGNPRNAVTWHETEDALRRSAEYAARPLTRDQIEATIEMVTTLEKISDMRKVTSALSAA